MLIDFIKYNSSAIAIVRDDLFPALGGGNKGRKMQLIAEEIKTNGCNAVVTTGGIQSNHCRAVAISAAENGWKCKLILHGDKDRFFAESGNAKFMRLSGVEIEFVEASEIGMKMDKAMLDFKAAGYNPYYIYGGGHNLKGGEAYVQAVDELNRHCTEKNWYPDYIFLASGTGSTHGGILAGLNKNKLQAKVVGISVARRKAQAETVVNDFYISLKNILQIEEDNLAVVVKDEYLAGGYECYNTEIINTVLKLAQETGIFVDPTYTGKAFWGMTDMIEKEKISGNILFWHTGGVNNLLSSTIL